VVDCERVRLKNIFSNQFLKQWKIKVFENDEKTS
jgi:hypothetical protein